MGKQSLMELTSSTQEETQKQRKKQAKQEARLMLEMEQARKDAQKAEQKVGKAQSKLEAASAQLQALEEQLAEMRAARPESQNGGASMTDHEDTAAPYSTEQVSDQPPTEGQTDSIFPEDTPPSQDETHM